jgi:hypothetical protein
MCGVPSEGDRFERAVLDVYRQSRGKQRGGKREGYDPIHGRHFSIPISRRSCGAHWVPGSQVLNTRIRGPSADEAGVVFPTVTLQESNVQQGLDSCCGLGARMDVRRNLRATRRRSSSSGSGRISNFLANPVLNRCESRR